MPKLISNRGRYTSPLVWTAAIACAILAIAVIITGVVVFAIYLIYQPKMPYLTVADAHLDKLDYDQTGMLDTEMTMRIMAENDNSKSEAGFSDLSLTLKFNGITVAELKADPFVVPMNSSLPLDYDVPSATIPLDQGGMAVMDVALKNGVVPFDFTGQARTKWRVGIFVSVRFWTHLSCQLKFFWPNGSAVNLDCSSKSH
ncbi:uncharacterized protein [Typha angustifolia]|uniref:uncharacterized protein n=1 Tax=Typha angustifolia TaxID=59011 RepID=UPI003C2D7134